MRTDRIKGTLGGGCLEAEIQHRAVRSLRSGQAATFDLELDHDFGWDDGLMCGGKVSGLILPNAQSAGEQFWTELAGRQHTLSWGVKSDFSIGRFEGGEGEPGETPGLLYLETVTPPCALWIAVPGTSPRRWRRWRCSWTSA